MAGRTRGPRWRILYLVVVLITGLLALDADAHLSPQGHEIAEAAIILGGYGLIFVWIEVNKTALDDRPENEDTEQVPVAPEPLTRPRRRVRLLDQGLDCQPLRHTGDGDGAGLSESEQIWVHRG